MDAEEPTRRFVSTETEEVEKGVHFFRDPTGDLVTPGIPRIKRDEKGSYSLQKKITFSGQNTVMPRKMYLQRNSELFVAPESSYTGIHGKKGFSSKRNRSLFVMTRCRQLLSFGP